MIGHDIRPASIADQAADVADPIAAAIAGQAAAGRIIGLVQRDVAHPDALHVAALEVSSGSGADALQSFHRRLQKRLERGH